MDAFAIERERACVVERGGGEKKEGPRGLNKVPKKATTISGGECVKRESAPGKVETRADLA